MRANRELRLVLFSLLLATLACNSPFAGKAPAAVSTPSVPSDSFLPARLQHHQLSLDSILVTGNGSDFYGPILTIQVTNPGTQDVLVTVPCGLIFEPDLPDQQPLMSIQWWKGTVPIGASSELIPYVICINDTKDTPRTDATYHIGQMAGGDLLKLANCVCGYKLTFNADLGQEFGLQFAVWKLVDQGFPGNLSSNPAGAVLQPFVSLYMGSADTWLKRCGLPTGS